MKLHIGDAVIPVSLNDSPVAQELRQHLPLSGTMTRYDDREFYLELPFTPRHEALPTSDFRNGDVAYFPPLNTFAIFYDRQDVSPCPGLIVLGRVETPAFFARLEDSISVTLEDD